MSFCGPQGVPEEWLHELIHLGVGSLMLIILENTGTLGFDGECHFFAVYTWFWRVLVTCIPVCTGRSSAESLQTLVDERSASSR